MLKFIVRRILESIPVFLILITLTFFMLRIVPGGPFDAERNISPEIRRNLEAYYGLNKPLWQQYFDYLGHLARGDLGPSFRYPTRSVNELIGGSFPVSMELGCWGMLIALLIGVGAGIIASLRPNTATDYVPMSLAMVGICVPMFVLGPLLVLLFALGLKWFNPSGWESPADRVLPALTLGIYYSAYLARLTRGGMLEILSQDFIRTARAKGASEARVVLKHALRGGLLPVVSFLGPALAGIISGSFIVETIFQIPGLGRYFIQSAFNRDFTLVLGTVIFYAALVIAFNLLVDILQVWLNPRLKFD
jgi:oligopeptide transport system permease protein